MTRKLTDSDVWAAFIQSLDNPALSKATLPINTVETSKEAQEWQQLTQHMEQVNYHRTGYVPKLSPAFIKQKSQALSAFQPQLFLNTGTESPILDLDRIDKRQLPKLTELHMFVVDLHGYTLPLGYERLKTAFNHAMQRKCRILKVITGKGRPNPDPENPTLRAIFPKWMQETYFNTKIIKLRKASPEHGGEGAFLIYLKQIK